MEISHYISWLTSEDDGGTSGNTKSGKDEPYPLRVPRERDQAELLQQYSLLLEYERIQEILPSGMYVLPSYDSLHTWHGVIFPRQGLYRGGAFKFELELPADYPESPPTLRLLDDIFHPMVDPETGRFDLESIFPEWWFPGRDYAASVLPHLHRALLRREYFSSSRSPLNREARELFMTSPCKFAEKAADCARRSLSNSGIDGTSWSASGFSQTPTEAHELLLRALHAGEVSDSNAAEAPPDERKAVFTAWFCDHYSTRGDSELV